MSHAFQLDRRAVLKGLAGVVLPLPLQEAMGEEVAGEVQQEKDEEMRRLQEEKEGEVQRLQQQLLAAEASTSRAKDEAESAQAAAAQLEADAAAETCVGFVVGDLCKNEYLILPLTSSEKKFAA